MSVKAKAQISIVDMNDIKSVTIYYLLQSSTLTAPAKPTAINPTNWSTTEPAFTSGTTNTLYTCVRTLWGDGSAFSWGDVNVSSSYEAAKAAYNKANTAQSAASATQQYFSHDSAGAHVMTTASSPNSGPNVLITANGFAVRDGTKTLTNLS